MEAQTTPFSGDSMWGQVKKFWFEEADLPIGSSKLTKEQAPLAKIALGVLVAGVVRYKGGMIGNTTLLLGTTFLNNSSMLKTTKGKIENAKSTDVIRGIRLTAWGLGLLTGTKSIEAIGFYIALIRNALKDAEGITPEKLSAFVNSIGTNNKTQKDSGTELNSLRKDKTEEPNGTGNLDETHRKPSEEEQK